MTDCPNGDTRDQLPDYVHERLDAAARARVAAHVATCASCAAEVELLGTARRVLTAAAPRVDIARIVAALPSPPQSTPRLGVIRPSPVRRQPAHLRPWRIAAVVATVAIGGASIAVIRGITNPNVQMPTPTAEPTVVLPDGGRIGELSDDDVQSLLNDIDHFDGVPDENPQPTVPALHPGGTL
jgi:anti-sigma factor RsiW